VAVELRVLVGVEAAEKRNQVAHAVRALRCEHLTDFVEHLLGSLADDAEDGVHVGVVAGAAQSVHSSELLEVKVARAVGVVFVEDSRELVGLESAADSLERFLELGGADNATAVQVKVLEEALDSLTFIVGTVSALTDLFEDHALKLAEAGSRHSILVSGEAPACRDSLSKVGVFFPGKDTVEVHVEVAEAFAVNLAVLNVAFNASAELLLDLGGCLLAGCGSRVLSSSKLGVQVAHSHALSASGDCLPSLHDDLFAFFGDIVLENSYT
jgi:hypothetical protein